MRKIISFALCSFSLVLQADDTTPQDSAVYSYDLSEFVQLPLTVAPAQNANILVKLPDRFSSIDKATVKVTFGEDNPLASDECFFSEVRPEPPVSFSQKACLIDDGPDRYNASHTVPSYEMAGLMDGLFQLTLSANRTGADITSIRLEVQGTVDTLAVDNKHQYDLSELLELPTTLSGLQHSLIKLPERFLTINNAVLKAEFSADNPVEGSECLQIMVAPESGLMIGQECMGAGVRLFRHYPVTNKQGLMDGVFQLDFDLNGENASAILSSLVLEVDGVVNEAPIENPHRYDLTGFLSSNTISSGLQQTIVALPERFQENSITSAVIKAEFAASKPLKRCLSTLVRTEIPGTQQANFCLGGGVRLFQYTIVNNLSALADGKFQLDLDLSGGEAELTSLLLDVQGTLDTVESRHSFELGDYIDLPETVTSTPQTFHVKLPNGYSTISKAMIRAEFLRDNPLEENECMLAKVRPIDYVPDPDNPTFSLCAASSRAPLLIQNYALSPVNVLSGEFQLTLETPANGNGVALKSLTLEVEGQIAPPQIDDVHTYDLNDFVDFPLSLNGSKTIPVSLPNGFTNIEDALIKIAVSPETPLNGEQERCIAAYVKSENPSQAWDVFCAPQSEPELPLIRNLFQRYEFNDGQFDLVLSGKNVILDSITLEIKGKIDPAPFNLVAILGQMRISHPDQLQTISLIQRSGENQVIDFKLEVNNPLANGGFDVDTWAILTVPGENGADGIQVPLLNKSTQQLAGQLINLFPYDIAAFGDNGNYRVDFYARNPATKVVKKLSTRFIVAPGFQLQ